MNWGDDLFYPPVRPTKTPTSKPLGWANIIMPDKPAAIRAQITRTTQKTPEVMVKITSKMGAGKGMVAIANHLDYISRNGKVQLEDHEGRLLNSRADVKDIKNDWAQDISEVTKRRETINVIFSMAKGTPAAEVKEEKKVEKKEAPKKEAPPPPPPAAEEEEMDMGDLFG